MIKTWNERCEDHPDHNGIVSEVMIQARMQEEIDELRAQRQWKSLTDDEIDRVTDQQWATNNNKPIYAAHKAYARAIEAKLKEKNNAR